MSPPVNVCVIVQQGNYAWVSCFETIQEVLADLACKQISVQSSQSMHVIKLGHLHFYMD